MTAAVLPLVHREGVAMRGDGPTRLRDRLAPAAVNYRTDRFSLKDDLDHLDEVQRAAAPEAVVFYCARIL